MSDVRSGKMVPYLLATLPPLFWAGNFLVARLMRDDLPPMQFSFWRWLLAFLIMLPFALPHLRRVLPDLRRESTMLVVLGLLGVTAFNCLIYTALHFTTVVNAALINTLMPVMTFLLALALLKDKLDSRQMIGVAISILGVALIIVRGEPARLLAFELNVGDFLVLAGLSCWALYTVLIKWRPSKLPFPVFLTVVIGIGTVLHLPLVWWEVGQGLSFPFTGEALLATAYVAVFPSVLAYIFWSRAVAALGPGRTGMFMHLMPIFSTFLAIWFLGESFQWFHAVGMALIIFGISMVTRLIAARKARAPATG